MVELNFHHLRLFLTVAQLGSFARAAEALYLRQPSVSAQVKELERSMGLALVQRSGRGFRLTEAGEQVRAYAERIFALAQELQDDLQDMKVLQAGQLQVGASTTVGEYALADALRGFQQRYPGIEVHTVIGNTAEIADRVARGRLRLGLVGERPEHPDLESEPFADDTIVLFAAPDHPLAAGTASAEAVRGAPMVMREQGSATRRTAEGALARAAIKPPVALEAGSNEAVKQAVAAGMGLGALSQLALKAELAAGMLKVLDAPWFDARRSLYVIRRRDARLSPSERAFVSFLQAE